MTKLILPQDESALLGFDWRGLREFPYSRRNRDRRGFYRVMHNSKLVLKVSRNIRLEEAIVQHWLYARHNMALPVLFWGPYSDLPSDVQRRTRLEDVTKDVKALVMPKALPWQRFASLRDVLNFTNEVRFVLMQHEIVKWEARERHVVWWDNSLRAIDLEQYARPERRVVPERILQEFDQNIRTD